MLIRGVRVFPEEGAVLAVRRAPTEEAKQFGQYAQYALSAIPAIFLTIIFNLVKSAVLKSNRKKPMAAPASAPRKAAVPLQIKKVSEI